MKITISVGIKVTPLVLFAVFIHSHCARILFFYGGGTYSQKTAIWPLVTALADRGHNITFLSPFRKQPQSNSAVEDVAPAALQHEVKQVFKLDLLKERLEGRENRMWQNFPDCVVKNCRLIAASSKIDPELQRILHARYDLIVVNGAFSECGIMWAELHETKFITALSTSILPWTYDVYGLPYEASWLPDVALQYSYPLSGLYDRAQNYIWKLFAYYQRRIRTHEPIEGLMMETLNLSSRPNIMELEKRTSLILMNTYPGTEFARSLPPYFVQVGGMQCWTPRRSLPPELQEYLDAAESGAILIAFGSTVDFSGVHLSFRQLFFDAIHKFPKVRFLSKWNGDLPEHRPQNVYFSSWLPQIEVLAHRNTRAFVSHCGLNSLMEATFEGVPVIAMPLFGDQDYNAYHIRAHGLGILLEVRTLTVEDLTAAIGEILQNNEYKTKMEKASRIFRDRPMNPVDVAVFWVEFTLRQEDTSMMKPLPDGGQRWWERHLLDVYLLLLGSVLSIAVSTLIICQKLLSKLIKSERLGVTHSNKKKIY